MIRTEKGYQSLCDMLKDAFKKPDTDADLSGYLALTDNILDLISNYEPKNPTDESTRKVVAIIIIVTIVIYSLKVCMKH